MSQLFLHRMPLAEGGMKFTIICSNDISDLIGKFLEECFEIEVMTTGSKRTLRSETRFELDVQDQEKIDRLNEVFSSEQNIQEAIMGGMSKAEYHKRLLSAFSLN